jgi:transcriptional regulator with XRE-family HTH domain
MPDPQITNLAQTLRARRLQKRLSLRDLSDQTGVSMNALSRVERGHVPDLKNFQRIVDWLQMPAEAFLEGELSTPTAIARHLHADEKLSKSAAWQITELVEEMYLRLIGEQELVAVHLRSAQMFTPLAGAVLADMLAEMKAKLIAGD